MGTLIGLIIAVVLFVFGMRLLGAWMLRINELITLCKLILAELKRLNKMVIVNNDLNNHNLNNNLNK